MKVWEWMRELMRALAVVVAGRACFHFWGLYGWLLFGALYVIAYIFTMDVLEMIEGRLEKITVTMRTKHTKSTGE